MRISSLLVSIATGLVLAGCAMDPDGGAPSRAEGRITDMGGVQAQSFGGAGTVDASTSVRASAVVAGGSLELLAEADVQADASYAIELPPNRRAVILQAVDASGEVLAAAILDHSGAPGERVLVTPMDSESSLEAAVYVAMIAEGASASEVSTVDLRARVTSELALAVRMARDRGEDVSAAVRALAIAVRAAQETEVEMYARAGVRVSQSELFEAELSASTELSAALHAGASASASYDAFFQALADAAAELRVTAEQQARAEAAASASFRATVRARISAESSAHIRETALLAAASLEARLSERAVVHLLAAGEAGASVQASATSAATELRASIRAATTASAAVEAYARFAAEVRGETQVNGSILGTYLGVDLVTGASVQTVVTASATAAAQLDTALDAAAQAALTTSGQIDTRALATSVAGAFETYFDAVASQRAALTAIGSESSAECAIGLLIVADGSFRS